MKWQQGRSLCGERLLVNLERVALIRAGAQRREEKWVAYLVAVSSEGYALAHLFLRECESKEEALACAEDQLKHLFWELKAYEAVRVNQLCEKLYEIAEAIKGGKSNGD